MWMSIDLAPKTRYIIIGDGVVLPDIVIWHPQKPERIDKYGTKYCAVPEGWFNCAGPRSRIANPTVFQEIENY